VGAGAPGPPPPRAPALLTELVGRYVARRATPVRTVLELWPGEGALVLDDPPAAAPPARADLVVGIAPWRYEPVDVAVGPSRVRLRDDASHVRLLEACVAMSSAGTGLFVLGMRFAANARPGGVCASLHRFGLYVEAMLGLPRGVIYPDSGPGRFLVCIRHGTPRTPVYARLTRDPAAIEEPLARLA
jgi:hypothetical protein